MTYRACGPAVRVHALRAARGGRRIDRRAHPGNRRVLVQQLERGDTNLAAGLQRISGDALKIVPECVGPSLASFVDGITYTLVSTSVDVASLDSVQHLDGVRASTSPPGSRAGHRRQRRAV